MSNVITKEEDRLKFYISRVGRMTVDEAMQVALEAEDICKHMSHTDIAYNKFKSDADHFFEYARLLEKEANGTPFI